MNDDNDQARFTQMYKACYDDVWKYVKRRVPDLDVQAITQEVFLIAWGKLSSVPTKAPLRWLYTTAGLLIGNELRSRRRRHNRERVVGGHVPVQRSGSADELVQHRAVHEALATLKDKDRLVLELIAFDGYTKSEVAEKLGMTRTAVTMRVHRLRNFWPPQDQSDTDDADAHPLVRLLGRRPHV